jgi:predicted phage terminase large subunit-like protein
MASLSPRAALPTPDALRTSMAEDSLADYVAQAWPVIEPRTPYLTNWHVDLLCEHLTAVTLGQTTRLIINIPPRYMKSILVSILWPTWAWVKAPWTRWMFASYAFPLSVDHSRKRRTVIQSPWYRERWGGRYRLADDQNVQSEFSNDARGTMIALSVGGGTGMGKGADCFPAGTCIATECGAIDIANLVKMMSPPLVWAFDHLLQRPVLRAVRATRTVYTDTIYELTTASGRVLHATGRQRVFCVGIGYQPVEALSRRLSAMWGKDAGETGAVPRVLPDGDSIAPFRIGLLTLPPDIHQAAVSGDQGPQTEVSRDVLLTDVRPGRSRGKERFTMLGVWATETGDEKRAVLFGEVSDGLPATTDGCEGETPMSILQRVLCATMVPRAILHQNLRGSRPCRTDDGAWQLPVSAWPERGGVVQRGQTVDSRTRWPCVSDVWQAGQPASSPYQRGPGGPAPRESGDPMQALSYGPPQIEADAVVTLRRLRVSRLPVYDLQVDGCHNFFANEILVHNCIVIDDPIDPTDAYSDAQRTAANTYYDQTLSTRLNNKETGAIILVMQRLHQQDLVGHVLDQESWEVVRVPGEGKPTMVNGMALPTTITFPLSGRVVTREAGDALWPAREPASMFPAIKRRLGTQGYASQYQQEPSPEEGGIIKKVWLQWYVELPVRFDHLLASWDLSFKQTDDSSRVAGQVWGVVGARRYLLARVAQRMAFPATVRAIRQLHALWPTAVPILIEDKANGPAVISTLIDEIPGIIAVNPQGDKVARCHAVAPYYEAGNVFYPVPAIAPWVEEHVAEITGFPTWATDDETDAETQALNYMKQFASVNEAMMKETTVTPSVAGGLWAPGVPQEETDGGSGISVTTGAVGLTW